jgi:hypothetical protein
MLLFRSEAHVDHWCTTRQTPRRPSVGLVPLWELAVAWSSSRLTPEARRPMGAEIRQIFDRLGLVGAFWET